MSLRVASRVGDGIEHADQRLGNVIALGFGVAGAAVAIFCSPVLVPAGVFASGLTIALQARNVMQLVSFVGNVLGTGVAVGSLTDGRAIAGRIREGAPSVHIGIGAKNAANASELTVVDCHDSWVAQGSETVFVEDANASRKGDKTECGGVIAEGCATVLIGGTPTYAPGQRDHGEAGGWRSVLEWTGRLMGLAGVGRAMIRDGRGNIDPIGALAGLGDFFGAPGTNTIGQLNRISRLRRGLGSTTSFELRARWAGVIAREPGRIGGLLPR